MFSDAMYLNQIGVEWDGSFLRLKLLFMEFGAQPSGLRRLAQFQVSSQMQFLRTNFNGGKNTNKKVLPGFGPGIRESESLVLTATL